MIPENAAIDVPVSRRGVIRGGVASCLLAGGPASRAMSSERTETLSEESPFLLGLNTSTIRVQKLSIVEEITIAAKAGYQGMEPWLDELQRYAESGGSLPDLAKRFRDAGISVES